MTKLLALRMLTETISVSVVFHGREPGDSPFDKTYYSLQINNHDRPRDFYPSDEAESLYYWPHEDVDVVMGAFEDCKDWSIARSWVNDGCQGGEDRPWALERA